MTTAVAAYVFTALVVVVAAFQVALAMGMPWGELTWGGRFPGRLPGYMRGGAVASAALLLGSALVVGARAGVFLPQWEPISRTAVWGVVAYCALGVLANAITPSRRERAVWLPVALVLLVCSVLVAMG
jgi:hypothetical protein